MSESSDSSSKRPFFRKKLSNTCLSSTTETNTNTSTMTNTPIEHRHQQQQHHQYQDQYQQLQRPGRMKLTHAQAILYPGKGLIQGQDVSPTSPPLQPLPRPLRIETEEDKIVEEEEGRGSSPVSVTSSVSSFPNKPKDGSKYKPRSGILQRFGKKIKHAFQKKPSSSLSPSSSSSSSETNKVKSETGGVRIFSSASEAVRAGVPGSTIPVHTYNGNNYNYNGAYANAGAEGESSSDSYDGGDKEELKEEVRRTTAKIRARGGDGSRSSINTRVKSNTWYAGQPPPIAIPVRSSSLHAYSTNDGGSGSGSPIELISWHGSPPQESSIENFPAFGTASAGTTSTAAAVLRAPTPTPMMGLPISRTKTRTRTTTITTTRTSPVITIKLVHTPSDQSSASSTTGSSDKSVCAPATHYHSRDQAILCEQEQEEGDDDSDECIEDLQAALELLRDRTESDSSDPFLTFDSTSPRYQDKQDDPNDRLSDIEEEDQETDRTDETGEKDFDSDESSTDGNKNGDNWPGSGFDNVPEASQGYFDDESYTSTSPPTRVSVSDQGAAGADSPTSEIIHSSTTTTPSAAALTTSTTQKNPPTTTTQGDAERESLNWIDHFLSLNGAYRDHLSTLHLQLAKALHDNLIQHTRGMIHLQHQILGVRGIGNGQLVSMFLEDLMMKKLQPRMQRDLREQRQFCLALGELVQQAFGRSMLTVDYEEDAYEGVRVDQVPRRWKGKKKKWSEDGSDEDEAMVSELEQEQEQGEEEEEEEEEEREVAKLAKRVDEASRASLPIDHEWSLFRWTFLQRPYATLMDLNQARTHSEHQHHQFQQQYQQQDSQQEQVNDTAGQNANDCLMEEDAAALSEEGQNEQKVDEDDNVWSLAGESSWLHGQADRSSHHDHDLDSNNGDLDDHGYDGENGEYELPLDTPGRSPAPFRSRRNHYPSSSRGSSSDDSAPAAGGNNITATPFYRHDPSNCRLESMNVPAFSEPGTPAGATTQTGTRAGAGTGAESGAAAVSSSTAAAGLNSNPEWIRVIRALTETDAASAAPGTRLPIWVVYAPSIPASSAAAAGTRPTTTAIPAATTAPAASATTVAHPANSLRDRRHSRAFQTRRRSGISTASANTSTTTTTATSADRDRKRRDRHQRRHRHHRARDWTGARVFNSHFQGGTHYHYNGSSTSMSSSHSRRTPSLSSCSSRSSVSSMSLDKRGGMSSTNSLAQRSSALSLGRALSEVSSHYFGGPGSQHEEHEEVEEEEDEQERTFLSSRSSSSPALPPRPLRPSPRPNHQPRYLNGSPRNLSLRSRTSGPRTTAAPSRCRTSRVPVSRPPTPQTTKQVYQYSNPNWRLEDSIAKEREHKHRVLADSEWSNHISVTSHILAVAPESSQPVLHRTLARFSVMDRFETPSGLQSPLKPQPQYSLYTLTFENCDPSQQGYADTAKSCDKKDRLSRSRSRDNVFTHRKYRSLGDSDAGDGGRHKSSSWNRGADIREAVLMLEGQRVEAAFQRASRLS